MVSHRPARHSCEFRGAVQGEQGGALAGPFTSNKNLALGAMNDMKNHALDMGANYVVLENTETAQTISGFSEGVPSQGTDVTHAGNAYLCVPEEIGLR